MKIALHKGLQIVLTAGLFLFLSFAGPLSLTAQAETYTTNISPGSQFGDTPPTFDSTLQQRESGVQIGKVVRKVEAATQTIPGTRMKDIGKIKRDPVKQAGAKAEKAAGGLLKSVKEALN
jgi:hypothetical protein